MRSPIITMALHIVIAYAVGLIGGNLLLSGLTDGLGLALLPGAFLASSPFAVVALLIGSPLHRQIDRYLLPLSVLFIGGAGVIVYLVLGDPGWGATSVFRTTAVVLAVMCAAITCLTLFILRRTHIL